MISWIHSGFQLAWLLQCSPPLTGHLLIELYHSWWYLYLCLSLCKHIMNCLPYDKIFTIKFYFNKKANQVHYESKCIYCFFFLFPCLFSMLDGYTSTWGNLTINFLPIKRTRKSQRAWWYIPIVLMWLQEGWAGESLGALLNLHTCTSSILPTQPFPQSYSFCSQRLREQCMRILGKWPFCFNLTTSLPFNMHIGKGMVCSSSKGKGKWGSKIWSKFFQVGQLPLTVVGN